MPSPPALSLQTSHSPSISDSTDHLSKSIFTSKWTDEQEARLQHCQAELAKAQKRWSASQDLWIEEVDHLLDLKKAHQKALKKKQVMQAKKAVGIWKKRTWTLSRTSSRTETPTVSATATTIPVDDTDADDEDDDDDDAVSPTERNDSMPDNHRPTTSRRSSLSNAVRRLHIANLRGVRKMNGHSRAPSGAGTPSVEEGFEFGEAVGVGAGVEKEGR